jgi:hypothetical protein
MTYCSMLFISVVMLYRILEKTLSIVKQKMVKYVKSIFVKTWFPLRGKNYFFLFLRNGAPGIVMVSVGLKLVNLSCMFICNFRPY